MMNLKFRPLMIIGVIFGAISSTFTISGLAELALPNGYVRYVALGLFAGAALISAGGLIWFLRIALIEWGHHDEQTRDIVSVETHQRLFVRSDGKGSQFRALGEYHTRPVLVPARRKPAVPLEEAQLNRTLYRRLVNGGNSHEHEH
jgi:hypothetical protein